MNKNRPHPFEALRRLAASLERGIAEEVAGGAMTGVRGSLPLTGEWAAVSNEAVVLLRATLEGVATTNSTLRALERLSTAASRGALDEFVRHLEDRQMPLNQLIDRVNAVLGRTEKFVDSQLADLDDPEAHVRKVVTSAMDEATDHLAATLPSVASAFRSFAPVGAEAARSATNALFDALDGRLRQNGAELRIVLEEAGRAVGRGVTAGAAEEVARQWRQVAPGLRRSLRIAAGVVAVVALAVGVRRLV